ncbi:MAG: fatty acid desaturase [Pseudomonadota bacterium]
MPSVRRLREQKRELVQKHAHASDGRGIGQLATTLVPLAALWWIADWSVDISWWLTAATILLISLYTLRVFALMHECGHGSLCHSQGLNRAAGFIFGVISGMPQYVWSQHHNYHHLHNGNWDKYRGPLSTLSVDEYAALNSSKQRFYRQSRHLALAPLGGFVYLIFNPRFNWLKGCVGLLRHTLRAKVANPRVAFKTHAAAFRTRYWQSAKEFRHMTGNNLVLLAVWLTLWFAIGAGPFIAIYLISLSIAGGAGIVLFTVQHNFEHAYAADTERWDCDAGSLRGTSFLVLPAWLNWFTANIGYHHIHHLSAAIPNYSLVRCHNENRDLFTEVSRLRLSQIHASLKCILWDRQAQRIISVAEYHRQLAALVVNPPQVARGG